MINLKQIIFEEIVSIEDLKYAAKLEPDLRVWARSIGLKKLGFGATRTVYDFGNGLVLKIVNDSEKIYANKFEAQTYSCLGYDYAAEVKLVDEDGLWLIMEKVKKINSVIFEEEVAKLLNLSENTFEPLKGKLERIFQNSFIDTEYTEQFYKQSEWYRGLYDKLKQCRVWSGDLASKNFGIRPKTKQLVLLDFGFEND